MQIDNQHRTAVIFYASADDERYQERAVRLLESLGGENIKFDPFMVISDGKGKTWVYRQFPGPIKTDPLGDLEEFLSSLDVSEYDQIVHSHSRHLPVQVSASLVSAAFLTPALQEKAIELQAMYQEMAKMALKDGGLDETEIMDWVKQWSSDTDNEEDDQ
jgi:hypothetical protein